MKPQITAFLIPDGEFETLILLHTKLFEQLSVLQYCLAMFFRNRN